MELKIQQADLIAPLSKAADLIGGKAGAAFLRTFWFQVKAGCVTLLATDASIEFRAEIPAQAEGGDFIIGLNGRTFYDLVKRLNGELTITRGKEPEPDSDDNKGGTLIVNGSGGRFELPGTTSDWFQDFKAWPEDSPAIVWSGDFLLEIFDRVAWCCAGDNVEDFKVNLCLRPSANSRVEACALDGYNVASLRFVNDDVFDMLPGDGICLHRAQIATLKRWIPADTIELAVTGKRLFIRNADKSETYNTPLSMTQYPGTDSMFARFSGAHYATLSAKRSAMIHALDTVGLFLTRENRTGLLTAQGDRIAISLLTGKSTQTVPAEYNGDERTFPANVPGLASALQHFHSDTIDVDMCESAEKEVPSALVLTGKDDRDYRMVVMGMQVEEETYYTDEEVE